jgi:methionine synthase II (cobalamin-independent)
MRLVFGELPDLPHLAELPARGPGADLVGRTAALLVDLPVETTAAGWRLTGRPGRDLARARGMLSADLDALEEAGAGYTGALKLQVCGPWTLAATVELARRVEPALADPGAVADLAGSLAEGVRAHLAEVRKRVPGARLVLQLDEPALAAVAAGEVPTASGLGRLPAPEPATLRGQLRAVIAAAGTYTAVHCCAGRPPLRVIRDAGADAIGFDLSLLAAPDENELAEVDEDELAEVAEAGLGILAGVVPATAAGQRAGFPGGAERGEPGGLPPAGAPPLAPGPVARWVAQIWRRLGWPVSRRGGGKGPRGLADQLVLTPACGLAGATPDYARAALATCRQAARRLQDEIEEGAW